VTDNGPIRLTIGVPEAGSSVLAVASAVLGSEHAAREVLAHGGLWHNRARVADGEQRVAAGDTLFIHRPSRGVYTAVTLDPARVLYEDADLIAVDKPPRVYVEATPWDAHNHLRGAVEQFLAGQSRRGELISPLPGELISPLRLSAPIHLVHRLDHGTSGVLLLSKNPTVNSALQRAFVEGAVRKEYVCLCAGEPREEDWSVTTGHGRARQGLWRVYPPEEIGRELPNGARVKSMATRFVVERRLGDAALLRAFPLTGRTHQIRLHAAHLGHPLLGDTRYGGPDTWRGEPLAFHLLHAARLELPHPRTGEPLVIAAPLPAWAKEESQGGQTLPETHRGREGQGGHNPP
jgi:23S rRNA pseudouridine1911/1915/1917 synthase